MMFQKTQIRSLLVAASFGMATMAAHGQDGAYVPGRLLVKLKKGASAKNVFALAGMTDLGEISQIGVRVVQLPPWSDAKATANSFKHRADIEFAVLDEVVAPGSSPNDTYYANQWYLPKISAPAAWDQTLGTSSVIVAILDTGVNGAHPDLAAKMVAGWNTYNNNNLTADVNGHGTAVAGTAAASSNNAAGVAAPAWNCKIMPIRISDTAGYGYASSVASGLTWAADHGARVANISYKFNANAAVNSAAEYFMSKGGVVVMSAGNTAVAHTNANDPALIMVSATDSTDSKASWSDYGSDIDIAAPGTGIKSTDRNGAYSNWAGTSFSAPLVAGVAALAISVNPALTGTQARDIVINSADDLGAPGWDSTYGFGRLNASRAVSQALAYAPDRTPPSLWFVNPDMGMAVSGTADVVVAASDDSSTPQVTLYADSTQIGTSQSSNPQFPWNTTTWSNGQHTLRAVAVDAAGNSSETTISVTVGNSGDSVAPTAWIVSPTGGVAGQSLTVTAQGSDNVGVAKLMLFVDGANYATSPGEGASWKVNTKQWSKGNHSLFVRAYDTAGNIGTSSTVTVSK